MSDLGDYADDELEAQRDFLLRSLADLDAEHAVGDVDEHDFETLRDGYTARAAAVLRLLDQRRVDAERPDAGLGAGPAAAAGPGAAGPGVAGLGAAGSGARPRHGASGGRQRGRVWRRAAAGGLVAAFAVGAGFAVAGASGQRLPGETGSGNTPGSKEQGELAQAVTDFQNGDVLNALKSYDQVLAADPANAEALAYKGWLLRLTGEQAKDSQLIDAGLASILQAEKVAPGYPDAHFFSGEIYLRDKDDPKDAITEFQTYKADNPPVDMGPEVDGELQAAQAALAGTAPVSPSARFAPVPSGPTGATGASGASGVSGVSGASGVSAPAAP